MDIHLTQTPLIRRGAKGNENLLRIALSDFGPDRSPGAADIFVNGVPAARASGENAEIWIAEPEKETKITVKAESGDKTAEKTFAVRPPKRYRIWIEQHSHHDPGYTDLMSHVFRRHREWIDALLDEMDLRDGYPEDARLRITAEQFWSLDHYLREAPEKQTERLISRVRRGDIELTALYGNMITEQLGHEEAYRMMYPAAEFARRCGVRISVAMHDDIPGMSWGLCRALCDARIEYLNADLPLYYSWGNSGLVSFWDQEKAYGTDGPGACRWISPDGKKLLLWNPCGMGMGYPSGEAVERLIDGLGRCGYPYSVFKASAHLTELDNSLYSGCYADFVRDWNEKYLFPHLVTGGCEGFFRALEREAAESGTEIPEIRGEMPGQDYPVAAMSMAQTTSASLRNQRGAVVMEKLIALTDGDPRVRKQPEIVQETWRDLLLADDHAYGYQFPAGPAMRASYWEKGTHAARAEADIQDLTDKAVASIADGVDPMGTSLRLLVFNPGPACSRPVEAPMRELDNCGTLTCPSSRDPSKLRGYLLNTRRRVNPEESFWRDGRFMLIDMETGKSVPYELSDLEWDYPEYYAPERAGLGSGTKRYGFFELPGGIRRVLRFRAEDLPAFGYRCYALKETDGPGSLPPPEPAGFIDSGIYVIRCDGRGVTSITDKRTGRELLDGSSPYRLGELLVTSPGGGFAPMRVTGVTVRRSALRGEVRINAEADGLHDIAAVLTAWRDEPALELSVRLLKSAKPLQTVFAAFPFAGNGFRYQGVLSEMKPGADVVPGGQSDLLAVKDYVSVCGSGVLWSSSDTAAVSLGRPRAGYVSPAHRCVMEPEIHRPLGEDDFVGGSVFALLTANNFGTNFTCSQVFDGVYKFRFAAADAAGEPGRAEWGELMQNPPITQFTDRSRGSEKPAASLIDTGKLRCLSLKKAQDGDGFAVRLWNHSDRDETAALTFRGKAVRLTPCGALEEPAEGGDTAVPAGSVRTFRFRA